MFIVNLLLFLISLSILVFVHELGHFLFAKLFKVYCHEFSVGMGPAIFQKKFKKDKETTYSIRALPIGGYVSMAGEEIDEKEGADGVVIPEERTLNGIAAWKRAIIVVAGAVVNFLFGLLLIGVVVFSGGLENYKEESIVQIETNSIAYDAGLRSNDLITKITITGTNNDVCLSGCEIEGSIQLFEYLTEAGSQENQNPQTIIFEYERNNDIQTTQVTRNYAEGKFEIIGISMTSYKYYPKFFEGIKITFQTYASVFRMMFQALGSLFTKQGISQVGGPVQIYQVSAQQAKAGFSPYLWFVAILSINLGFMNLLPIPALDGARFITSVGEMITRKKFNPKVEKYLNFIGMILLLLIMLLVTVKDVIGLF